jgi:hypothetical protein
MTHTPEQIEKDAKFLMSQLSSPHMIDLGVIASFLARRDAALTKSRDREIAYTSKCLARSIERENVSRSRVEAAEKLARDNATAYGEQLNRAEAAEAIVASFDNLRQRCEAARVQFKAMAWQYHVTRIGHDGDYSKCENPVCIENREMIAGLFPAPSERQVKP